MTSDQKDRARDATRLFLLWAAHPIPAGLTGPWEEIRVVADDLAFVASTATLSAVYHQLKWSLPEGTAVIVTPLDATAKFKGLPPGTTSWVRGIGR